jgi:signal transduction histidine kinase
MTSQAGDSGALGAQTVHVPTRPNRLRLPAPRPESRHRETLLGPAARVSARQLAYALSAMAAAFAMTISLMEPRGDGWPAFLALLAMATPLLAPRYRTTVFGVGATFVAMWAGEAPWLAFTVGAAVLVAVAEDLHEVAWRGWAFGLVGCVLALVISPDGELLSPFIGVLVGGLGGVVLRSRVRGRALEDEAGRLRGHTEWLEQRTAIARELHDIVGHHVTAMVVQAEAGLVKDPHAALQTIGGLGRAALTELDDLVVHLRDPLAPMTVSAPPRLSDIDELLAAPLRSSGVLVEVSIDPQLALSEVAELAVYRIAQEALTNVSRHARATHAWVELSSHHGLVHLLVADDGVGPHAVDELDPRRGSGLVGIDERVSGLGGQWSLSARPGGGTLLHVEVDRTAVARA